MHFFVFIPISNNFSCFSSTNFTFLPIGDLGDAIVRLSIEFEFPLQKFLQRSLKNITISTIAVQIIRMMDKTQKGTGIPEASSKYSIHMLVLANFQYNCLWS